MTCMYAHSQRFVRNDPTCHESEILVNVVLNQIHNDKRIARYIDSGNVLFHNEGSYQLNVKKFGC